MTTVWARLAAPCASHRGGEQAEVHPHGRRRPLARRGRWIRQAEQANLERLTAGFAGGSWRRLFPQRKPRTGENTPSPPVAGGGFKSVLDRRISLREAAGCNPSPTTASDSVAAWLQYRNIPTGDCGTMRTHRERPCCVKRLRNSIPWATDRVVRPRWPRPRDWVAKTPVVTRCRKRKETTRMSTQSQVDRSNKELASLGQADAREAEKEVKAGAWLRRAQEGEVRATSDAMRRAKRGEVERAALELARIGKRRADLAVKIANKVSSLNSYLRRLRR